MATVHVYEGMGTVLRCPECDSVLLRVVHARGEVCMEMRGVSVAAKRRRMTRSAFSLRMPSADSG